MKPGESANWKTSKSDTQHTERLVVTCDEQNSTKVKLFSSRLMCTWGQCLQNHYSPAAPARLNSVSFVFTNKCKESIAHMHCFTNSWYTIVALYADITEWNAWNCVTQSEYTNLQEPVHLGIHEPTCRSKQQIHLPPLFLRISRVSFGQILY